MSHGSTYTRVSPPIEARQQRITERDLRLIHRPVDPEKRGDLLSDLRTCALIATSIPSSATLNEAFACLSSANLFQDISKGVAAQLASTARPQTFAKQQILFREDEPINFISVVASGRVKITQLSRNGKEVILRVDCPGDVLDGLEPGALLHCVSARALEPCRVFSWDLRTFAATSQHNPIIHRNATKMLAERLRWLEERFRDMATELVPQRLARMLIRFVERNTPPMSAVPIGLSYEDLAQMVGTTPSTVSRVLCRWAAQGIIEPERKAILIENLKALMEVAAAEI